MNCCRVGSIGAYLAGNILKMANRATDSFRMYYRPFGAYGLLALWGHRFFGWPEELAVRPGGIKNPVHLRIRTSDVSGCEEILLRRQYEIDIPFSPKTIVDAGANIGMASIYFAHKYPDARIVAVEPEAANFAMLVRNVKPYPGILPVNAALWNCDGQITVSSSGPASDKVGFVVRERGDGGVPARALTMRTLMKEAHIHSIDILKVDIEGAERVVFESCDWIDSVRCLVIELHDRLRPGCSAAVTSVTRDFSTLRRGETTIFIRKSHTASVIS